MYLSLTQETGHLDPLFHALAHTDDASAADPESNLPGGTDGLHLLRNGMGGTELSEIGGGGLDVAMVILYATVKQLLELLAIQQSHRGTALDVALLLDGAYRIGDPSDLRTGQTLTAGN